MVRPVFGTLIVQFSMKVTRKCVSLIGVAPVFITTTSSQIENKKLEKIMYGYNTLFLSYCFPFISLS
jgi:hypothetical protein